MDTSAQTTTHDDMQGFVFCCVHCGTGIVANSREHDECITADGEEWYCVDCSAHCPLHDEDDEDDESEPP